MQQLRNSNIELLRFILMAAICFWHVIIHGYGYMKSDTNSNLLLVTFCCALFSPAVYCFMFISGWYGIKFSLKKFVQLVITACTCFWLSIIIRYFWGGVELKLIVEHIFPISSNFWWFLTCYVMVFLIAPFINLGFEQLESKMIKHILIIMTFIEILCLINLTPSRGSTFFGLLYIYCLGRYIKRSDFSFSNSKLMLVYFLSLVALWVSIYWGYDIVLNGSKLSFILLSYNNPCIILMAICIFFLFQKFKPTYNSKINYILTDVLAIYLLTEGIGGSLYHYLANTINQNWLIGILLVFLVMFIALIIGKLISNSFIWLWEKTTK